MRTGHAPRTEKSLESYNMRKAMYPSRTALGFLADPRKISQCSSSCNFTDQT